MREAEQGRVGQQEIVSLKPPVYGVTLNLKALWARTRDWKKKRAE